MMGYHYMHAFRYLCQLLSPYQLGSKKKIIFCSHKFLVLLQTSTDWYHQLLLLPGRSVGGLVPAESSSETFPLSIYVILILAHLANVDSSSSSEKKKIIKYKIEN